MTKNKTTAAAAPTLELDAAADFDGSGGQALSGGFEGPSWVPHLHPDFSDLKDSVLNEKIAKIEGGATNRRSLKGTPVVVRAFGRRAYALDVVGGGGKVVRVLLPEHGSVYAALNTVLPGKCVVGLLYEGKKKMRNGNSAHDYKIAVLSGAAALAEPRADALHIESKEEREKKQKGKRDADDVEAARRAAAEERAATGDAGDADDLPF